MASLAVIRAGVAILVTLLLTLVFFHTTSSTSPTSTIKSYVRSHDAIPNLVHYVHLMKNNTADDIHFEFRHWLSIYHSHVYFKPDAIYIHTDASEEALMAAPSQDESNKWTRLITEIPGVSFKHADPPQYAAISGVEIKLMEHKSDFVRMEVLKEYGGIYLDTDVYPLKDVKPLREAGFNAVVGREGGGRVNNGVMMSKAGSVLLELFSRDAHAWYDGGWLTASVGLLTKLAERLVAAPNEVLIMEDMAFGPTTWRERDRTALYEVHNDTKVSYPASTVGKLVDPYEAWDNQEPLAPWQKDLSKSYTIHAFRQPKVGDKYAKIWGCPEITLDYVLNRQSNFARLTYPAVRYAVDSGILPEVSDLLMS